MVVFIIPLISKEASPSWENVVSLLEKTLRSICNQIDQNFKIIVVCSEVPEVSFQSPKIEYCILDKKTEGPTGWQRKVLDKGRKMLLGLVSAKKYQPKYVMFADADDYISNRIAGFALQHYPASGWFVNKGYRYFKGSRLLFKKYRGFHKECGTSHIIRYDHLKVPEQPDLNRGYGYYQLLIDHEKMVERLRKEGVTLDALPWAGSIYFIHGKNLSSESWHSRIQNKFYFDSAADMTSWFKNILRITALRPITKNIKKEFNFYCAEKIAHQKS